jgi:hypothetical protein
MPYLFDSSSKANDFTRPKGKTSEDSSAFRSQIKLLLLLLLARF